MGLMLNRRRVYGGKSLPYDAEIEYLQSSGTQWIDTGLYHREGQSYTIDMIAIPTNTETDFFATTIGDGGMIIGFYNYFVFGYNRPNTRIDTGIFEVKEAEFHIEYKFNDGNRTLTVNGISYSGAGAKYSVDSTIRIFAGYQGHNSSILCQRVVIRDANDNLLIDLIPVRVGQVGYMYDRVSKQLFGNSGTGAFYLGPDKGEATVSINVKTHSTGSSNASLDVITGHNEPFNIPFSTAMNSPWTNGYIRITYQVGVGWKLFAVTSCLYDGQVYNSGELIATWIYKKTKDITIIANI